MPQQQMEKAMVKDDATPYPANIKLTNELKATTVRDFPHRKRDNEAVLTPLDEFYIKIGVKEMPNTKATTSPLEWNSKVLGLLAVVFTLIMGIGGLIWYAASLAANVQHIQSEFQKHEIRREAENMELKNRLSKIEDYQRQADLRNEAARGFNMGVAESKSKDSKQH